jgi:hypothetical protein
LLQASPFTVRDRVRDRVRVDDRVRDRVRDTWARLKSTCCWLVAVDREAAVDSNPKARRPVRFRGATRVRIRVRVRVFRSIRVRIRVLSNKVVLDNPTSNPNPYPNLHSSRVNSLYQL